MENDSKQYYVKLPLWKKCTFGIIDSANNFSWSYISSFLAIYLTDTFLIPAATVSLMFLLCRFWDAINDPIVGYLADRTRSRWGRYRPWIMFASAPLFITTALLFWPHPEWAVGVKTAYVVILYALVVLFYTMVNLTYGSLNSVVTQDPAERGSLASWRLLFAYIGSTLMVQLVTRCEPVLSAKHPNMGYFILAVIFAVFCIPVCCELDLKKAAKAVGEKSIAMLHSRELLPLTGYVHGVCSPIGMKKQFPTVFHETAEILDTIMVSAGKIGFQVELSPADLIELVGGSTEDVTV